MVEKPDEILRHRFNADDKAAAVLRVLKGEQQTAVAKEMDITVARLANWEQRFLRGGREGLVHQRRGWASKLRHSRVVVMLWLALVAALMMTVYLLVQFFEVRPE